jgi:copper(I)-binding protein
MHRRLIRLALILAATLPCSAIAADPALMIHDPYVRLAPPNAPASGAFMVISNSGKQARKLIKAASPAARTVELHNHINDNGVMRMREVANIEIKASGQTELKPGSYHVMLIGMHQPLKEGDTIPITLSFDDGSSQQVSAPVRKIQLPMHDAKPIEHGGMKQ